MTDGVLHILVTYDPATGNVQTQWQDGVPIEYAATVLGKARDLVEAERSKQALAGGRPQLVVPAGVLNGPPR